MSDLIQQFIGISEPDQLPLLDTKKFAHMHFQIYWKDQNNRYQGANDQIAIDVGLNHGAEVINHYDMDFYPNEADSLIANDRKVLAAGKSILFTETATMHCGTIVNGISHKAPWHSSRTNKLLGIIGYSIVCHKIPSQDTKGLSTRQLECVYYLVKGSSIKKIAKILSLSPRTVEHYLETAKTKLGCITRTELVEEALKLHIIKEKLRLI